MSTRTQSFPEAASSSVVAERLATTLGLGTASARCTQALARIGRLHSFDREDEIIGEGQRTESLFVLLRGSVKMSRSTPMGRTVILAIFSPGEAFGAVATLATGVCDASMKALEPCQCLEIERRDLFRLFAQDSDLTDEILPLLTRQLVECKNCLVELTGFRVDARFAHIFLKLGDHLGLPEAGGVHIPLKLSRQELADMSGTTIETCIRLMSRWKAEALVETRPDGFLVRDPAALAALSGG